MGRARLTILVLLTFAAPAATAMSWSLLLQEGQIGLALPDIHSEGWAVTGIHASLNTAVDADNRQAEIRLNRGSRLRVARIIQQAVNEPLQLDDVRVDLGGITATLNLGSTGTLIERSTVAGRVTIKVGELQHPRLKTQAWRFDGTVNGPLSDLTVEGQLQSDAGLMADVTLSNLAGEMLAATVAMAIEGTQGSKAMAETFTDWPALLELDAGRVKLEAELRQQPQQPVTIDGRVDFDAVGGLLDRTAVTDLSGQLSFGLEQDLLVARFREVTIGQINPGIAIGPVRILADYRAAAADPLAGALDIQQATAVFLGGSLRVAPSAIELAQTPWQLPIEVYDVSLARLLQVYPTEGLEGTGKLSGRVPLVVSDDGVEVEQGKVSAIAPGGLLKLPAERLQAMLGSSEAMGLVVAALQNFHYSVLDSTIDYDNNGKLMLALRLEGDNPEVRGGQAVVLNINLEEDIPALLTSLQLSGRVNEAVTERVRERLQQSGQERAP